MKRNSLLQAAAVGACVVLTNVSGMAAEAGGPAKAGQVTDEPAVRRAIKEVQMLDDLYKTVVVLITEHYVNDPSTLSAASASKALFAEMKKKGWHEVRLLGFTDALVNQENKPQDDFERAAQSKLLTGQSSHEQVVTKNGERYLRMATPVPVVMEKCVMCHENFRGKEGAIGSLSYTIPIDK
jgi:hypothetical protein